MQWYLGAIIAAWTVFGFVKYETDVAWRVPVALQCAMPAFQLVFLYWIPESPRWLCSKGQTEKALQILVKVRYLYELISGERVDHEHSNIFLFPPSSTTVTETRTTLS